MENIAQKDTSPMQSNRRAEILLIRLYSQLLRFYPTNFRTAFSDEMITMFALTLRESSGHVGWVLMFWREVYHLPVSLWVAHRQAYRQLPPNIRRVRQIHWFVRITAGLLGLFLLSTMRVLLSPSYNLYAQAVPFVVALFVASVSLLLALLSGRVGGLLTIASGVAIGCCMTLYLYVMAVTQIGLVLTVIIGLLWALPFLIFGLLFYELNRLSRQQSTSV